MLLNGLLADALHLLREFFKVLICLGKCVRLMLASYNWNKGRLPNELILGIGDTHSHTVGNFVMQDLFASPDHSCGINASVLYPVHIS